MNIPLSLLIYNPIEAYALVLLCDIITGNRTRIYVRLILYLYIFGVANLLIQNIPNAWVSEPYFAIISIFMNYIVTPLSIKFFYKRICGNITYKMCVMVSIIDCLFIIVISSIFDIFIKDYNMFYTENKYHEFVSNLVIFSVQITLYLIIRAKGEHYYEKLRKNGS